MGCGACATSCAARAVSTSWPSGRWDPTTSRGCSPRRSAAGPSPALVAAVHDSTQGTPFFVEELAAALRVGGLLRSGRHGLELARHGEVPLPDTVRDAVLISASELSADGRAAAEAAAVAGEAFDLDLAGSLSSPEGVAELLEHGLARELGDGEAAFRHGLARDALYADVPWMRRRGLHRALAQACEEAGAPSATIATHWLGARDSARARDWLLRDAAESEAVHAFRDAAEAGRQALDLWPDGEDHALRSGALERYARCAELSGQLAEAARAWRELASVLDGARGRASRCDASRPCWRCAATARPRSPCARRRPTRSRSTRRPPTPRSSTSRWPTSGGCRPATARRSSSPPARAPRPTTPGAWTCACARSAWRGWRAPSTASTSRAVETVRAALAVALAHDLTVVAAELYQRLSVVLYDSADFPRAEEALETALDLCERPATRASRSPA